MWVPSRFIRSEEDDAGGDAWEVRLARRYYAKLFREYAIVDLSRYKARTRLCWGLFSCPHFVRLPKLVPVAFSRPPLMGLLPANTLPNS